MDEGIVMARSPFLSDVAQFMLVRNYSRRTIDRYLYWIKYFILFSDKQHPKNLHAADIERILTFLAVKRSISPSTQAIVLNALVFLKTKYLQQQPAPLQHFQKAVRQQKLPIVLTQAEVGALLKELEGVHYLMAALL